MPTSYWVGAPCGTLRCDGSSRQPHVDCGQSGASVRRLCLRNVKSRSRDADTGDGYRSFPRFMQVNAIAPGENRSACGQQEPMPWPKRCHFPELVDRKKRWRPWNSCAHSVFPGSLVRMRSLWRTTSLTVLVRVHVHEHRTHDQVIRFCPVPDSARNVPLRSGAFSDSCFLSGRMRRRVTRLRSRAFTWNRNP